KAVNLIFPHQLFEKSDLLDNTCETYLVEEHLFFKHYKFHRQKIAFHRASMMAYADFLKSQNILVNYVESIDKKSDVTVLLEELLASGIEQINFYDPVDNWLLKRINRFSDRVGLDMLETPYFINTNEDLSTFFRADKKSFFQTTFYKQQRTKHNVLLEKDGSPEGGKWTYDVDNRKKYPKGKTPPAIQFPESSQHWEEAINYVKAHFDDYPGVLDANRIYPITFDETATWLDRCLMERFEEFGIYEDAIVKEETFLNHSLLSPLMNAGLISPREVINQSLLFAKKNDIPLNSLEGFIRQIMGWREFIRGMYVCKGSFSRTQNFWGFERKIPQSFYDGTTGIEPVDDTIKKVLATGYCHHIERLMVLGNFMLLCEFHPDEVYRWFMELFIDAYDWVMVPNVYGMSQFADGGTFATKPYIGGSNYIKKMSNYGKGPWTEVWDGLFWRFISVNQDFFLKNPRMSMMVHSFNRMSEEKKKSHLNNAADFLAQIDNN
ncbi:MAG: cryptochrome/photolyase family protein, partial [Crocinitomicaceae bacterium]|nr:cryptochrome/photolyase family protein [Crocinitomicaceae bacterium]